MDITEKLSQYNLFENVNFNQLGIDFILAIFIVIFGVIFGKLVYKGLKHLSKKSELNKKIRGSFINLILVVIKWSIYLIFINLGLQQLKITALSNYFTIFLITIPAFIGALAIIAIGFMIAIYLREVIEDAEITGWDLISKIIF